MQQNGTTEQLLITCAHKGDPSAFFTLFSTRARELYLELLGSGSDHHDAIETLVSFHCALYKKFIAAKNIQSIDRWYAGQQKHLLGKISPDKSDIPHLEHLRVEQMAQLDNALQTALQREFGRIRARQQRKNRTGAIFSFLGRSRKFWIAFTVLALGAGLVLFLQTYLKQTGATVRIILSTKNREKELLFPVTPRPIDITSQPAGTPDIAPSSAVTRESVPAAPLSEIPRKETKKEAPPPAPRQLKQPTHQPHPEQDKQPPVTTTPGQTTPRALAVTEQPAKEPVEPPKQQPAADSSLLQTRQPRMTVPDKTPPAVRQEIPEMAPDPLPVEIDQTPME